MNKKWKSWQIIYLVLADYIIPVPLTILMYYLWLEKTGSITFTLFILLLGLVYGYVVPGIASNVFKLWKFTWPLQWKNIFITHGFIYTSFFSLAFYLSFPENMLLTWQNLCRIVLANFAIFAIICSHHEIIGIKEGMIKSYNSIAKKGGSAVDMVAYFSFFSFGFLGGSFAIAGLYAYEIIIIKGHASNQELISTFLVCMLILILGSTPYFIKERKQIIINRNNPPNL